MNKKKIKIETVIDERKPSHTVKIPSQDELDAVKQPGDYDLKQVPHVHRVDDKKVTVYSTHRDYSKRAKAQKEEKQRPVPPDFGEVLVALKDMSEGMKNLGDSMMKIADRVTSLEGKVEVPDKAPEDAKPPEEKAANKGPDPEKDQDTKKE